ncbi:MAG: MptD family putative ECF transporter S component [Actinomycetaceae bacterium]|nr:MptD family putative ECF transporter S component [Actinomycetaceae bacterium]
MSLSSTKKGQDAITIGIFTALYLVIAAAGMAGLIFGPVAMTVTVVAVALINGITFMMFVSRVYSAYAIFIMGVVMALLMLAHGWTTALALLVSSGVSTLCILRPRDPDANKRPLVKRRSKVSLVVAYAVFNLWYIGPILPIYLWQDSKNPAMLAFYTPTTMAITEVLTFIFSLIGAWLGIRLRKRHFERAGLA